MENKYKALDKPIILIAEDNDSCYLYVKEIFRSSSIELIRAINGAEAVEICRNNSKIFLVLMDIKMPIMNGFDATRKIKAINKNILVVAVTAYAMKEDEAKAREAGCDDYFSKPLNSKKMKAVIDKYLVSTKLQLTN
ncbi:MAG: response regulator [Salinivirgaceae bacterium]|jgi:two-component system cell cycle response regulator DivK|nr:response regulator [Salinivirgaceae bacterium]